MDFYTQRMLVKSTILVKNGKIVFEREDTPKSKSGKPLLDIVPNDILKNGFLFLDKNNRAEICHIGFYNEQQPYELSYGTEEKYRGNGFMSEALERVLEYLNLR